MRRLLLLCLLIAGSALADEPLPPPRPRIGLVLSGGGARGLAHIGVLRVLEELKVPVDLIVGTSMGAVVGGAYASGRSVDELEALVKRANWSAILSDRPARERLSIRRREDDERLPSRIEFGFNLQRGAMLPSGAAANGQLEATLSSLLPALRAEEPLRKLPIPFRAVATDLLSGAMLDQADTPLFQALRASMAVPGVFAPLRVNGRPLVDGGLVRNLPIDLARALGADVIIAVNVGTPLLEDREITSAVMVANQMLQILTEQNVQRSLRELRPQDIVIDPDLAGMGFMDFSRADEAMATGRRAALAAVGRLQALAAPAAQAALQARRLAPPESALQALPLAALKIEGTRRLNPEALKAELALQPGDPVGRTELNRAVERLDGTGDLERIELELDDRDGRRSVNFKLTEADWAASKLRFGLELYSNFADANRFSLVAMHVADWLNPWGAELRSIARIGSTRGLDTEFYQPLGPGSRWFASAKLGYEAGSNDVFNQGQRALRLSSSLTSAQIELGHRIAGLGDLRFGLGKLRAADEVILPAPPTGGRESRFYGQQYLELHTDTLDSLAFPSRGQWMTARIEWLRPRGDAQVVNASLLGLGAFRLGEWAGQLYGEAAHAEHGQARSLGGYLRLSGTPDGSLVGENMALLRVVMARRIGEMPVGLGGAVRIGFSLEAGAVGAGSGLRLSSLQELGKSGWKQAGSGFLSVDTRFGPFFLAVGTTRGGDTAAYLLLGPTW
ncbi:patatin-like phospholipase family protein [Pelomonas aquatica]|jgi:NTE family protein|uniref:Patatin domain-containing protein n=1 Tax=Pelomonas aquatica TaxID=431058 RepID=A0A9X4R2R2_9BURK|nr:patatin-like phospholipase family protein [Pelomonas aquatica]MCY4753881.1 patatin-like phospholipase family protein [Pelomonas aquatica]MDG0861207.1 patatin domain-containing protein [Pelomonas aquatica]